MRRNIRQGNYLAQAEYSPSDFDVIGLPNMMDRMSSQLPPYVKEEAARLKAIYLTVKGERKGKLTQAVLAEECGWSSQGTVSQFLNGTLELNLEALLKFAAALHFEPHVVSPRLAPLYQAVSKGATPDSDTVVGPAGRLLPVIGYVQAGAFCEAVDLFQPGDADEWVEAGGPAGPHAFIVRVEGISMTPDFFPGDKVVVDPDQETKHNDFVLAKRTSDQHVTLKKLQIEGAEAYLLATNPSWPDRIIRMSEEWTICGRVRRKIVDF
ncbi:helix-turn-helix domain-containing protein [Pseudomonas nitroreducens]|uniref:helix-turn-helix domain-containing protein n=1 Tax=Pseudomonas nitroreducens TaxID=46680 RepID=UPI003CC82E38